MRCPFAAMLSELCSRLKSLSKVQHYCSGMLPGLVAGFYTFDESHVDLAQLCTFASTRMIHAEAVGIDKQVCPCPLTSSVTSCKAPRWCISASHTLAVAGRSKGSLVLVYVHICAYCITMHTMPHCVFRIIMVGLHTADASVCTSACVDA